jgi:hypothetical protein
MTTELYRVKNKQGKKTLYQIRLITEGKSVYGIVERLDLPSGFEPGFSLNSLNREIHYSHSDKIPGYVKDEIERLVIKHKGKANVKRRFK